ncbi:SAM-dependent methyltransferase [Azorhizobium doebereinerae]|uniref:SAM-dependent methyltransferase n=1 Tax=Azorhizobium doebereinerae TaxID=281091 RepID=UPI0004076043|nr:cyclopropane-fatty-acyl-phospholipid synthase family protein [Azorhizobium doebereinerae]
MEGLLEIVLRRVMTRGSLGITTASGRSYVAGVGDPKVRIRFTTTAAERRILFDPELYLGEAVTDGTLIVEQGTIADLLDVLMAQPNSVAPTFTSRLLFWARLAVRRIAQFNPRGRSQRNVAHHYDLDGRLYSLFLDSDRQYSCAYFEHPGQSLDDAQLAKKRHLAAKLVLDRPGLKLLDIGCGWGGLGLYMAEAGGAEVTGVTLSREQLGVAQSRVRERGLERRVDFRLQDYRDIPERFDRIVSVGMFEHVGIDHYGTFFRKTRDLLADDGVMVLHSIGRQDPPGVTNPWIAKYIFPGGYIPALSEVLPQIESAGLVVTDIEILRLHYAETLKAWRERFMAHREEARRLTDERFCRLWEFYLAGSEMAFRHQGMMVFQIQLARRQEAVPLTRDYLVAAEERLRAAEFNTAAAPLRLAGE